jgi:hypothetical protein
MLHALLLLPMSVAADGGTATPPPDAVTLQYERSGDCPTEEDFAARLRKHAPRIEVGDSHRAGRRLRVLLEPSASGYRAMLYEKRARFGDSLLRQAEADNCQTLADAMALIVAMTADPSEKRAPAAPGLPPAPPEAYADRDAGAPSPVSEGTSEQKRWHVDVGAGGAVAFGLGPEALFGAPVWLGVRRGESLGSSVAAGFFRPNDAHIGAGTTEATLQYALGTLLICQAVHEREQGWAVSACARATVGSLHVQAPFGKEPSQSRAFMAVGLGGAFVAAIAKPLSLRFDLGLSVPVAHYYVYSGSPEISVYSMSYVGTYGALGLSLQIL